MAFNSFIGFFFAAGVVTLCWALPARLRNLFLLIASFAFYAYGDFFYCLLLGCVIIIGFVGGQIIETAARPRLVLAGAISALLAILGVFKYFNFFTTSFVALLAQFGLRADLVTVQILLPIGISFYTFQTIGYLIDVYRQNVRSEKNLVDFALFVSFFPQLVAGPIERSHNLLRQIKTDRAAPTREDISYGFFLIVQGYAKKIVIADTLAPYVDLLFQQDTLSAPLVIVGLIFFAFQIYGDFSGYTDIARGYARLCGFKIVLNFDRPYFASSPSNFWRRWHISLSAWFTEYVYIALGGNRSKTALRRWSNVVVTMALSGLWHGAALNFVVWGAYHGAIILGQRWLNAISGIGALNQKLGSAPSRIITFILILYGWLYFRVEKIDQLMAFNKALVSDWTGWFEASLIFSQGIIVLTAAVAIDLLEKFWLNVHGQDVRRHAGLSAYLALLIVFIALFAAGGSGSFIYFRF